MGRWDLQLRDIYSPNEPNFRDAFGNALVTELERYRQTKAADQEMRNKLAMTPGVTFEKPVRTQTTPLPQPVPVMPKPQYDHATGKLIGLVDAGPGATIRGAPRPTVDPSESPLDQALAALSPQYNEITLPSGGHAYIDTNYSGRKDLERVSLIGRQSRYETNRTNEEARQRATDEYAHLLAANPADTRLGKALRSVSADVWANNPTLRDNILAEGNKLSPEETFTQKLQLQNDAQSARMDQISAGNTAALARTLAQITAANNRSGETQASIDERARQERRLRRLIAENRLKASRNGRSGNMSALEMSELGSGGPAAKKSGAAPAPVAADTPTHHTELGEMPVTSDPMALGRAVAASPAMRGQPVKVIAETSRYYRAQQILNEDPDISPRELQEQLEDEGFYGSSR